MVKNIINDLIEQFSGAVTVDMILLSVLTAFAISLYIVLIYRKTFDGVVYSKNTSLTIIMLTLVTSVIIRTINSNLSLSLGMVGALSIVRFRTAIKEPLDTTFLFWAIASGIMTGAGLYIIAIVTALALGLLFYAVYTFNIKGKAKYLLVVNYKKSAEDNVLEAINKITNKKLKNKYAGAKDIVEITYEVVVENDAIVNEIKDIKGVNSVNLIAYKNEVGM